MTGSKHERECGTCGYPTLRAGGHADWCWTNDPTQPCIGDMPIYRGPLRFEPDPITRRPRWTRVRARLAERAA